MSLLQKFDRAKTIRTIIQALEDPMTAPQVSKSTGFSETTVRENIRLLHADGRIHISGWDVLPNNARVSLWLRGAGDDAPMPKTQTKADRAAYMRSYKQKLACASGRSNERFTLHGLYRDWRPELERLMCPDLGKLPMVPFARP